MDGAVGGVGPRDPVERLVEAFGSLFEISAILPGSFRQTVTVSEAGATVLAVDVNEDRIIERIVVHRVFRTPEGIGPGDRLSDLIAAYGRGRLEPTDQGPVVYFETAERLAGIGFLIDGRAVPRGYRVADDTMTPEQEERFFSLGDLPIKAIVLTPD